MSWHLGTFGKKVKIYFDAKKCLTQWLGPWNQVGLILFLRSLKMISHRQKVTMATDHRETLGGQLDTLSRCCIYVLQDKVAKHIHIYRFKLVALKNTKIQVVIYWPTNMTKNVSSTEIYVKVKLLIINLTFFALWIFLLTVTAWLSWSISFIIWLLMLIATYYWQRVSFKPSVDWHRLCTTCCLEVLNTSLWYFLNISDFFYKTQGVSQFMAKYFPTAKTMRKNWKQQMVLKLKVLIRCKHWNMNNR